MIDAARAWRAIQEFLRRYPVRAEQTGQRSLEFSKWLRENCRPSKRGCKLDYIELGCFVAFDLDFILHDYSRDLIQLLEVKTRSGRLRYSQRQTLLVLDRLLSAGAPLVGVKYLGLHVLRMNGLEPWSSQHIEWDGKEVNKQECWRLINMLDALDA